MRILLYLILSVFILLTENINSQTITGFVNEKDNQQPIEGAAVSLLRARDTSFIKGTETGADGKFVFSELTAGSYTIRVTLIGYSSSIIRGVRVTNDNPDITLETVFLNTRTTETEEIIVETERSAIEFSADKKTFNVEENAVYTGGNAIDILRNLPSVTIDADNNVSLRGSENVKIFVDGRPFGMEGSNRGQILEQLSADQISSIEIISNPSAKYEAEGTAGIINIVLKKKRGSGYNGTILLNAGTKDKYKGSLNLNWRTGKVNLFGNYDFNLRNFSFDGTSNRIFINSGLERYNEDNSSMRMKAHLIKAGLDYSLDNTTSLNLSGRFSNRNRSGNDAEITRIFDTGNNNSALYNSYSTEEDKGYNYDISTSFLKRFKNQGQNLTADLNFSYETEDETETTEINYTLPESYISRSRQFTDEKSRDMRAQIDYVHPLTKERKFETGTKYTYRDRDIDYRFENFDTTQNIFTLNTDVSNVFKYRENILALYNTYTDKIGNLGYQLGLRGEYTYSLGDLLTTGETFKQNYFDVFPSVSLSYTIATGSEVQASYSRRVERPRHRQLNPFLDISDPTNLQKGNPALKPEYIDSYELGYLQYIGNISVTPSVFYRVTNDRMARQRIYLDSITTLNTFVNYDKSTAYGAELLVNGQITRWWGVNGSLSWFETEIDASNVGLGSTRKRSTWTTRLSTSMRLPDIANLQANYIYTGKMYTAQGYIEPMQSLDLALNRDIIQDRLNLALRMTDVFNTMQFKHVFEDQQSNEFVNRKRESRNVFLTLTYKFGQDERNKDKRSRNRNEDEQDIPEFDDF